MFSMSRVRCVALITALGAGSLAGQGTGARSATDSARVITIHAATLLDGRGGTVRDATIMVRGASIQRIDIGRAGGAATYELGTATLLPGLIDAHVHPGWYINAHGALHNADNGRDGETAEQSASARAANLLATLMAGVTTIQSVGGREDAALRDGVERGLIPGPRILTSLGQINSPRLSPDSLRLVVRRYKATGADVIKLFASAGLGAGGEQTLSDEQLAAICGEARALGLRSVVHAISAKSVRAATLAGCTEIEHGTFATDAELRLMADHGTIFDPQVCLVFQNYVDHREEYGRSGYTEETFATLAAAIPTATAMFKRALATPGLRIIFGTDAVALAHGRNAEELICRVEKGGQNPMDAIVSATSATANALGLGEHAGALAPGFDADIIAVDGDPSRDIQAIKHVVFVMRAGKVWRER
jgi:imidazolonepropionase-like amidohydrolase